MHRFSSKSKETDGIMAMFCDIDSDMGSNSPYYS